MELNEETGKGGGQKLVGNVDSHLKGPLSGWSETAWIRGKKYDQMDALGFGSVSNEDKERITLKRERAGDQLCLRMSMQMLPRSLIFMW